jgi:hypothetical protein
MHVYFYQMYFTAFIASISKEYNVGINVLTPTWYLSPWWTSCSSTGLVAR